MSGTRAAAFGAGSSISSDATVADAVAHVNLIDFREEVCLTHMGTLSQQLCQSLSDECEALESALEIGEGCLVGAPIRRRQARGSCCRTDLLLLAQVPEQFEHAHVIPLVKR